AVRRTAPKPPNPTDPSARAAPSNPPAAPTTAALTTANVAGTCFFVACPFMCVSAGEEPHNQNISGRDCWERVPRRHPNRDGRGNATGGHGFSTSGPPAGQGDTLPPRRGTPSSD